MKIHVDYDLCVSTGACMQAAPEVFEVRSDGYMYVLREEPDEAMRSAVEAAVAACPTGALSLAD